MLLARRFSSALLDAASGGAGTSRLHHHLGLQRVSAKVSLMPIGSFFCAISCGHLHANTAGDTVAPAPHGTRDEISGTLEMLNKVGAEYVPLTRSRWDSERPPLQGHDRPTVAT
jgi:hypothetical protein